MIMMLMRMFCGYICQPSTLAMIRIIMMIAPMTWNYIKIIYISSKDMYEKVLTLGHCKAAKFSICFAKKNTLTPQIKAANEWNLNLILTRKSYNLLARRDKMCLSYFCLQIYTKRNERTNSYLLVQEMIK